MKRIVVAGLSITVALGFARLHGGEPPARPAEGPAANIAKLIDRADRVVVREAPDDGARVLFESANRRDLDALKAALKVNKPDGPMHCMCDGTPAIDLYAGKQRVGQITNHHGKLVRWSTSRTDAPIADAEAWLTWFDVRGIGGPRREADAARRSRARFEEAERRWVAAMPAALRKFWPMPFRPGGDDVAPLRRALEEAVPDRGERIRALFAWYGSGMGPWSGFPSHEQAAEDLLLDYPTAELLAAIADRKLGDAETEGAARLFGGWSFSQVRPKDLALLPAELKRRLLEHSLKSDDEDKRGRARRAFGD